MSGYVVKVVLLLVVMLLKWSYSVWLCCWCGLIL